MKSKLIALVCASSFLLTPGLAIAKTTTTTMPVQANVVGNCTVNAAGLTVADYDPSATTADQANAAVTVSCTTSKTVQVAVTSANSGSGGNYQMADGSGDFLNYGVYSDTAYSVLWSAPVSVPVTTGSSGSYTGSQNVYVQIPVGQYVTNGAYSDTLNITVIY